MNSVIQRIVATPSGTLCVLAIAAYLEVYGDACVQDGLYHSSGGRRALLILAGAVVLCLYSLFLNSSKLDFGKLLGLYVVLFFVVAQLVSWLKFHQRPTVPIYVGGTLIVLGGIVMSLWKN